MQQILQSIRTILKRAGNWGKRESKSPLATVCTINDPHMIIRETLWINDVRENGAIRRTKYRPRSGYFRCGQPRRPWKQQGVALTLTPKCSKHPSPLSAPLPLYLRRIEDHSRTGVFTSTCSHEHRIPFCLKNNHFPKILPLKEKVKILTKYSPKSTYRENPQQLRA